MDRPPPPPVRGPTVAAVGHSLGGALCALAAACGGTVRALVVRGAAPDTLLPEAAARTARELPVTTVVGLAGTSHFLPTGTPNGVAGLIRDFIGDTEGG